MADTPVTPITPDEARAKVLDDLKNSQMAWRVCAAALQGKWINVMNDGTGRVLWQDGDKYFGALVNPHTCKPLVMNQERPYAQLVAVANKRLLVGFKGDMVPVLASTFCNQQIDEIEACITDLVESITAMLQERDQ